MIHCVIDSHLHQLIISFLRLQTDTINHYFVVILFSSLNTSSFFSYMLNPLGKISRSATGPSNLLTISMLLDLLPFNTIKLFC